MAPLAGRRKPVCFYCNCKSAKSRPRDVRQWKCERCEAVNYLDEDGEVADPPVDATASNNIKYAHSIRRPPSPVFDTQDEALFCATCIKNQHFLTQALASYLPATTDSNYQVYEDSFPEYKKELEDRYPPICERCAPRASDRLKATSYAAKTDHVRRMMDRTRDASISRRDVWDWRGPMLALGAISWWSSSALFVLWHVAGATTGAPTYIRHSRSFTSVASRCFQIGSGSECVDFISPYVSLALVLAILSSWWNPCISEKLRIQRGRMVGLSEFYRLQFATVFVRVLAWLLLGRSSQMLPGDIEYIGLHAFLGGFNILMFIISHRTIQINYAPRVSFQDSPEPLVVSKKVPTFPDPAARRLQGTTQTRFEAASRLSRSNASFPINSLAPRLNQSPAIPHKPPTPPPDEDDEEDAMDWQPTSTSPLFGPSTRSQQPISLPKGPSPFYGHLPPAPISQAQRLRNPPNQPALRRVSNEQRENFFRSMINRRSTNSSETDNYSTKSNDGTEEAPQTGKLRRSHQPNMADPKFFPAADMEDTGLESLFNAAFSLGDEPLTLQSSLHKRDQRYAEKCLLYYSSRPTWGRFLVILILVFATLVWLLVENFQDYRATMQILALGIVTGAGANGFIEEILLPEPYRSLTMLLVYGFLTAVPIYGYFALMPSETIFETTPKSLLEQIAGPGLSRWPVLPIVSLITFEISRWSEARAVASATAPPSNTRKITQELKSSSLDTRSSNAKHRDDGGTRPLIKNEVPLAPPVHPIPESEKRLTRSSRLSPNTTSSFSFGLGDSPSKTPKQVKFATLSSAGTGNDVIASRSRSRGAQTWAGRS
ncbi:hypothetical protein MMC09_005845 [Bachmanniomyces sp. S44760]|nr:hypothetical protein [Bachmanniomyces sp. S44760]